MSPVTRDFHAPMTDAEKAEQQRILAEFRKPVEVKRAEALIDSVEPLLAVLASVVDGLKGPRDTGSDGLVLIRLSVGDARTIVANARALGWIALSGEEVKGNG